MHIGRVVHVFPPEVRVDPFYSHELSVRQVERGHRVSVATWNYQRNRNKREVREAFDVYRLKGINFRLDGKISEYPFLPNLSKVLEKIKPDIIHAHSHLFLTTVTAVKEARKLGCPSVVSVHGVVAKRDAFTNFAQQSYLQMLGRYIFRKATRIICLTISDANEVMRYGAIRSKIRIIPNAVNLNLFNPSGSKSINPVFVWVGNFVPEKGLQYLVKAIKVVEGKCKNAKFVLIGDGPLFSQIKNQVAKYNLNHCVEFTGFMRSSSVSHTLSKATGFIFPSLKEGMPKAVLEAMACGLPIITSNVPGMGELVKDGYNGLLVSPQKTQAMGEMILNVINDRSLAERLGRNARKTVREYHNWKTILDKLDLVYEEALKCSG